MTEQIRYRPPGDVARDFILDRDSDVCAIEGPIGSGKSSACVIKCVKLMMEQQPLTGGRFKGKRSTKGVVVRSTYPELRTTTMRTWSEWLPEESYGTIRWTAPYEQTIRFGDVVSEVLFLALEDEADVKKLLSMEYSWAWLNEAREMPLEVVEALDSRFRYPPRQYGGITNPQLIMDSNAAKSDHWWSIMFQRTPPPKGMSQIERDLLIKPEGWTFYLQPPAASPVRGEDGETITGFALNDQAENLQHLPEDYYERNVKGKQLDFVLNMVCGEPQTEKFGEPVYSPRVYSRATHVRSFDILPTHWHVGLDFGLTPAIVFMDTDHEGRLRVFAEYADQRRTLKELAAIVKAELHFWKSQCAELHGEEPKTITVVGDPSGTRSSEYADSAEDTAFVLLAGEGLEARPAETNEPSIRIGAVEWGLSTLVGGVPMLTVHPRCHMLIAGFAGGYAYARRKEGKPDESVVARPVKNAYSHPHDALQYGVLSAGFGRHARGWDQKARNQSRFVMRKRGRDGYSSHTRPAIAGQRGRR